MSYVLAILVGLFLKRIVNLPTFQGRSGFGAATSTALGGFLIFGVLGWFLFKDIQHRANSDSIFDIISIMGHIKVYAIALCTFAFAAFIGMWRAAGKLRVLRMLVARYISLFVFSISACIFIVAPLELAIIGICAVFRPQVVRKLDQLSLRLQGFAESKK